MPKPIECDGECGNPAEIELCVGDQRYNVCLDCFDSWVQLQR